MTYGGSTYAGAAYGSISQSDGKVGRVDVTSTASAEVAGTGQVQATAETQISVSSTVTSLFETTGLATATTTTTGIVSDATGDNAPIQWRVTVDDETVEQDIYDVEVEDTANPFGNYAVIKIDDHNGEKFEKYSRGTRIDAAVSTNTGISYVRRFTGYVVERRELNQNGADSLEVEAYSFDQFLRNNKVSNDQSGKEIIDILEDIITTDTPVSWNASKVTVGDAQELTRSYRGEPVEEVLRDIAFKSESEDFGVDDELDFFFRPRESEHIDRGISDGQWFNYDIPELGKEVRNEVEVWFNDGNESVIVDDGQDKLDLQDSLDLPDPGTQRAEISRPDITTVADAEAEGRKYLQFRNSTLSGTVTTYGLFDAQPGDTIDIEITERGIDGEFRIAAINYQWGVDATRLTIVEKRGEQDDVLYRLSGTVKRMEMENANRDAPSNRITTTQANALLSTSVDADGNSPSNVKVVNTGRNAIRNAWKGDTPPSIDTISVGDDGSGLSRANTDLNNQTDTASATSSLDDATTVSFSGSVTQTGVAEISLETNTGVLIARAVFDSPVDLDGTVEITIEVSNDDSVDRSVLTTLGQTAVRDILANNDPDIPARYGYGTGQTLPQESDTSLDNLLVSPDLDLVILDSADSDSEWADITPNIAPENPIGISNGALELHQTTFLMEAENADFIGNEVGDDSGSYGFLSNSGGVELEQSGDIITMEFTPKYTIPNDAFVADFYYSTVSFDGEVEISVNDSVVHTFSGTGTSSSNAFTGSAFIDQQLDANQTHSMSIECTQHNSGRFIVDVLQVVDLLDRYSMNQNRSGTWETTFNTYDGPYLYPSTRQLQLDTFTTRRPITEAQIASTWNDTSNNQFIELSNDGGTNWIRTNNDETANATFSSPETDLDVNLQLSRYTFDQTTTPSQGDGGQSIDRINAFANPDSIVNDGNGVAFTRVNIDNDTLDGETITESGLLNEDSETLTRHIFAEFTMAANQLLISAETTAFNNA